jgi:hypothetical protein
MTVAVSNQPVMFYTQSFQEESVVFSHQRKKSNREIAFRPIANELIGPVHKSKTFSPFSIVELKNDAQLVTAISIGVVWANTFKNVLARLQPFQANFEQEQQLVFQSLNKLAKHQTTVHALMNDPVLSAAWTEAFEKISSRWLSEKGYNQPSYELKLIALSDILGRPIVLFDAETSKSLGKISGNRFTSEGVQKFSLEIGSDIPSQFPLRTIFTLVDNTQIKVLLLGEDPSIRASRTSAVEQ